MKKLLVFSIIFTLVFRVNAQSYIPFDTADISWSEVYESGDDMADNFSFLNYFVSGDTLIQNQRFFKIFQVSEYDTLYMGAFRESNKQVFYDGVDYGGFDTDSSVLIYDFTKSIGDTVHEGSFHRSIIAAIDSVQVSEEYRKRFTLENDEEWIEGIGSTRGFLFPITNVPTMYWHSELVCFKHNEEIFYLNPSFSDCTTRIVSSVKDAVIGGNIEIFPNPVERGSPLAVKTKKASISKIQIYNQLGVIISAFVYSEKNEIQIDTEVFTPGFYILLVLKSDQDIVKMKLVVK